MTQGVDGRGQRAPRVIESSWGLLVSPPSALGPLTSGPLGVGPCPGPADPAPVPKEW